MEHYDNGNSGEYCVYFKKHWFMSQTIVKPITLTLPPEVVLLCGVFNKNVCSLTYWIEK